ncbi:nucleolar GTP-binding protein 1 isoform X2 [Phalaenopsis equestris]|uniref:nucleolar GTP-binding protein 1 isoform X2 n=1 Tax=Phalaenopsis equestris TaxID=78828 RepID=UPI0009E24182|nr:nucleolar GTP-binding protein 1 isoform X2 [Phalaenopsis equestris]
MTSGSRILRLIQQWLIPSSGKLFLLRSRGKEYQLSRALPTLHVKAGSFKCFQRSIHSTTGEVVDNDYAFVHHIGSKVKPLEKLETIGAFQKLPMVMPSADILSSALRKARNIAATKGIANIAKRERNKGAKQLDALMKELAVPLRVYIESFPKKWSLHPYERSLIQLTFGDGSYEEVLKRVDDLRKKLLSVGKQHASFCAQSLSKREAEERLKEGLKKLEEVFELEKIAVDNLLNVAKTLRAMPVVDLQTPTLCLVGAPNVGKSSLVRILSTGKPEVCNYPFTTRGILMGHIALNYENYQVTDTPGLLRRHDDDRNNLELLTLAVLEHLPTAILYVHDLTGECGISSADQFIIYKDIKGRFGDRLWLDVVSKSDLRQEPTDGILNDYVDDDIGRYQKFGPDGAIWVSVQTEAGISELKSRVKALLTSQKARIRKGNCSHAELEG